MKRRPSLGPERYLLPVALLIPLAVMLVIVAQVPGVGLAAPTSPSQSDDVAAQLVRRPQPSRADPPPTLVPPTATPLAAATPLPAAASTVAPEKNRSYTVQPGDELKTIAASYNVSIWTVIQSNNLPNPDSLHVGQVLKIPDD